MTNRARALRVVAAQLDLGRDLRAELQRHADMSNPRDPAGVLREPQLAAALAAVWLFCGFFCFANFVLKSLALHFPRKTMGS